LPTRGRTIFHSLFSRPLDQAASPDKVAALDLGSNSFHLIIARVADGTLQIIDREREMVRLAAGLDEHNCLSDEAMARAMDCLDRFGQLIRDMPPGTVRVAGTNTLRKARNAQTLIEHAEQVLGHPVEIIAGAEEARLIYLGVAHSLSDSTHPRLVVDIGGGSTEVILGQGFTPHIMESLPMGCVSYSRRFLPDGQISIRKLARARLAALQELEPIATTYRRQGWQEAVGASGTVRAVRKVIEAMGLSENGISAADLSQLVDTLARYPHTDKLDLPGLAPERAPIFPAGAVILLAVFEALRIDHMSVSDGALREGLLYDVLGRIRHEDVRSRTVEALQNRYSIDTEQARRVTATARRLFEQAFETWQLADDNLEQLFEWGTGLHETGMSITHSQHHKHGAYILQHADMPGFSRQEQEVMAILVRAQRRKFPQKEFEALPASWQKPLSRLALLLRLSVLLHRARNDQNLPAVRLRVKKKQLQLKFPDGWLETHPLTRADLEQEAAYLDKAGFSLKFE
jgi:exopolyphosphatase/guanosine-5'-triphosphate,3'-diphosphate pyrophosphatase